MGGPPGFHRCGRSPGVGSNVPSFAKEPKLGQPRLLVAGEMGQPWRDRYGFLIAQRRATDQKRTIVVLGFLAACSYFRVGSPRCNCAYYAPNLLHCISSFISSLRTLGSCSKH